jgi:hypothetical protein
MKTHFTLKDLFKLSGKKGDPMGSEESCIYFDGKIAAAAGHHATLAIDCHQRIGEPILVSVKDLKTALTVAPDLTLWERDGYLLANGVRVPRVLAATVVPPQTMEILELERAHWRSIVRPFRIDGGRWKQLMPAMAGNDIRFYLNGAFMDFSTGAIVTVDGNRLHLIEGAIPVVQLPPEHLRGIIIPSGMVKLLSAVGGVQESFVLEKLPGAPTHVVAGDTDKLPERAICFAVANGRFRIRTIASDNYPNYREPFERNRSHPVAICLDVPATSALKTVARVAGCNTNYDGITIEGAGSRMRVSHLDRISQEIALGETVSKPFTALVRGGYLMNAIDAAGSFGVSVWMRYSPEDGRGIYVGAEDFHAIVMTMKDEVDEEGESIAGTDKAEEKPLSTVGN